MTDAPRKRTRKTHDAKETTPGLLATPENPPVRAFTPYVDEDGTKYLNSLDMAQYELRQARCTGAYQALALRKTRADLELVLLERQVAELRRVAAADAAELTAQAKLLEEELRSFQEKLEVAYSVDFRAVTYDDVTGAIGLPE